MIVAVEGAEVSVAEVVVGVARRELRYVLFVVGDSIED